MAQATLNRVLEDIRALDLSELSSVERAIQARLETEGYSLEEWRAMQSLVEAGVMNEIRPRCNKSVIKYTPIPLDGQPLSETIIEERR